MKVSEAPTGTGANFTTNSLTTLHQQMTITTEITQVVQTDGLPASVLKPEKIRLSELAQIAPSYAHLINSGKNTIEQLERLLDNVSTSELITNEAKDINKFLHDNGIVVSEHKLRKALSTARAAKHTSAVRSIQKTWHSIIKKEGVDSTESFSANKKKELLNNLLTRLDKRKKKLQITPALIRYALYKAQPAMDSKITWLSALIPESSKPKKVKVIVADIQEKLKKVLATENELEQLEAIEKLKKTQGLSGNTLRIALKNSDLKMSQKKMILSRIPEVKLTQNQKSNYITSKEKACGRNKSERLESQLAQTECRGMNFDDFSTLLLLDGRTDCQSTIRQGFNYAKITPTPEQEKIVIDTFKGIDHDQDRIHESHLITLLIKLKPMGIGWMLARKVLCQKYTYIPTKTIQQASAAANVTFTTAGLNSLKKNFYSIARKHPELSLPRQVKKLLRKCKNLEVIGAPKIVRMLYEIKQYISTALVNVVLKEVKGELAASKETRRNATVPSCHDVSPTIPDTSGAIPPLITTGTDGQVISPYLSALAIPDFNEDIFTLNENENELMIKFLQDLADNSLPDSH